MDNFWILCLAAGVLLIRVGMSMSLGVLWTERAVRNTLVEIATCTVVWSLIAPMMLSGLEMFVRGVMSGEIPAQHLMGPTERMAYLSMLLVGSGLISMLLREDGLDRVILSTLYYVIAAVLVANMTWYGRLALWGLVDLGGLGPIFLTSAIMCAVMLFRRRNDSMVVKQSEGGFVNLPGVLLTLVGLVPYAMLSGFLHESYRDGCMENVLIGAGASALAATVYCALRHKPNLSEITASAMLCGAIATLSMGGMVTGVTAALVGVASGIFVPIVTEIVRLAGDRHIHAMLVAFAVGGAWGLKSVAVVMPIGEASRTHLFGVQAGGAFASAVAGMAAGGLMLLYCTFSGRRSRP